MRNPPACFRNWPTRVLLFAFRLPFSISAPNPKPWPQPLSSPSPSITPSILNPLNPKTLKPLTSLTPEPPQTVQGGGGRRAAAAASSESFFEMRVSESEGYPSWGPNNKDDSIWGSTLGFPYLGKLPNKVGVLLATEGKYRDYHRER